MKEAKASLDFVKSSENLGEFANSLVEEIIRRYNVSQAVLRRFIIDNELILKQADGGIASVTKIIDDRIDELETVNRSPNTSQGMKVGFGEELIIKNGLNATKMIV